MNAESILNSDVLDIIFENRNKYYGAYHLRKFYPGRLKRSLSMVFLMVMVFCVYAMMPATQIRSINIIPYEDPKLSRVKPLKDPAEKVVKTKADVKVNTQKLVENILVAKEKDSVPAIKDLTDNIRISGTDITGGVDDPPVQTLEGPTAVISTTQPNTANQNEIMDAADVQPQFPGGINALRHFLERNLQNPREMEAGELVAVKAKFVVGYDGALRGFEIVQDGGEAFNNEVIRVLKKMPGWIPGKSNGENVSVYYSIPVKFVAND